MSNLTPAQQEMYTIANDALNKKIDDIKGGCCLLMLAFFGLVFLTTPFWIGPISFYIRRGHF